MNTAEEYDGQSILTGVDQIHRRVPSEAGLYGSVLRREQPVKSCWPTSGNGPIRGFHREWPAGEEQREDWKPFSSVRLLISSLTSLENTMCELPQVNQEEGWS